MAAGFTLEQMRAKLAELEAELEEDREFVRAQVARTRRWLDLGGDRELFEEDGRELAHDTESHSTGGHYLLGEHVQAAALAPQAPEGLFARSAIHGNAGLARQAREELLALRPSGLAGPHHEASTGDMALATWDWIEESFLLEARLLELPVPSHPVMLRRTGRLL